MSSSTDELTDRIAVSFHGYALAQYPIHRLPASNDVPAAAPTAPPTAAALVVASVAAVNWSVAATPPAAWIVPTSDTTVPKYAIADGTSAPAAAAVSGTAAAPTAPHAKMVPVPWGMLAATALTELAALLTYSMLSLSFAGPIFEWWHWHQSHSAPSCHYTELSTFSHTINKECH
jgi:hypothetical protein